MLHFSSITERIMRTAFCLCLCLCLSLSLSLTNTHTHTHTHTKSQICSRFSMKSCRWTRETQLAFGNDPNHTPDHGYGMIRVAGARCWEVLCPKGQWTRLWRTSEGLWLSVWLCLRSEMFQLSQISIRHDTQLDSIVNLGTRQNGRQIAIGQFYSLDRSAFCHFSPARVK